MRPTSPSETRLRRSQRARWRWPLLLGMGLLALVVVASARLIDGIVPWALALALAALTGELLMRWMLGTLRGPLEALHEGVRTVGAGDYGYHVPVPEHTGRELAGLGWAFNEMSARLQESQQELDAYEGTIEEIVTLRTREVSRKALQLAVAAGVSNKIATILDPPTLIQEVVELIQQRFNVYHVDILLVDAGRGIITSGRQKAALPPIGLHDHASSVIAWVAHSSQTLYAPDIAREPRYWRDPDLPDSRCELAIPLTFGGHVIGVLNLEADHPDAFQQDDMEVLESLANGIAVSLHNAQMFAALETANRDLAEATHQAKQASAFKSRFLLNVSHKLRTPLNAIIGYSETILSGIYGEIPDKARDRQRRILENGRQLQALIEDMLDLASIQTGQIELALAWIELPPLLEEVMNAARALHQTGYPNHALALRLEIVESLPPVWADVDRLRYVLMSLLGNAVKFTPSGEVVLRAERADNSVRVHVADTGPGIRDEELEDLFEPFQHRRGSTESSGKGTGLGLSVSRLLARMHGGDLTVSSTLDQGSTFTLWLPCHTDSAPPV